MDAFRTVLCPIDFTPLTRSSLEVATRVCQRFGSLLILHHNQGPVPPDFLTVHWMWSEEHEDGEMKKDVDAAEIIQKLFDRLPDDVEAEARITRGPLEKGVLFLAKTLPADLVVMGSHGPSSAQHRSVTERVVLESPSTVLTIGEDCDPETLFAARPGKDAHDLGVLVVLDRLDAPSAPLEFALALAERMPHELHLLHVVEVRAGAKGKARDRHLEEARRALKGLVPELLAGRCRIHVATGNPAAQILRVARETEPLFLLIGTHKKRLLRGKRSRETNLAVLHGAECPVWFIPEAPPGSAKRKAS